MKTKKGLPKEVATARMRIGCVANPIRWQIIELLEKHRKLRPIELQQEMAIGQSHIGAHLKELEKNGIVGKKTIRYGEVYYRLLPRMINVRAGINYLNRA